MNDGLFNFAITNRYSVALVFCLVCDEGGEGIALCHRVLSKRRTLLCHLEEWGSAEWAGGQGV